MRKGAPNFSEFRTRLRAGLNWDNLSHWLTALGEESTFVSVVDAINQIGEPSGGFGDGD